MTPPLRDPIKATHMWRHNEEVFGRGNERRYRPGVTFDLDVMDEDVQKESRPYRRRFRIKRKGSSSD